MLQTQLPLFPKDATIINKLLGVVEKNDLWRERIAVRTYNKNVKDNWSEEEFTSYEEILPEGEKVIFDNI